MKKNVTSVPQAISAYARPTKKGAGTEFGNVLGASLGFASFAAVSGAVVNELKDHYGEKTGERVSEPRVQTAIGVAAGVAAFVIADQLARNGYANVMPTRQVPGADGGIDDDGDMEIPEIEPDAV